MLPPGSSTYRSRSSGWPSGQLMVTRNSALDSTLPCLASGFITRSAMKNRKVTTCSALNSITLKGSNGRSVGKLLKLSIGIALQHGDDEHLGEVGREREQFCGRGIEHVVLGLHQDRADQAGERR